MDRIESLARRECWVDVYDADHFQGRMRRLVGPKKLRKVGAKSVIVGPSARVLLNVRRRGRDRVVTLPPRQVIPNLAAAVRGEIRGATIVHLE
jgi:hypothetical protein